MTDQEKNEFRNKVIDECIEVINYAREEGESDLRSIRAWIEGLKK